MMKKRIVNIEQVRDFVVDAPDLLIIVADPKKDELFVTYKGEATFGAFGSDILDRALSKERFGTAHRDFGTMVMQSTAKVMNAILDGMQSINEALSSNKEEHGESKESSSTSGSTGSPHTRGKGSTSGSTGSPRITKTKGKRTR